MSNWWRARRHSRPPAGDRPWVHPSELPNFDSLDSEIRLRVTSRGARLIAAVMALLLVVGTLVLMVNRAPRSPGSDPPTHEVRTVSGLPTATQSAAARLIDLTVTSNGSSRNVAALVVGRQLAVTTTFIAAGSQITGSSSTLTYFPVTLLGHDHVMGFSIVRLGAKMSPPRLGALPASTAVVAVAPVMTGSTHAPKYAWVDTTLGDPANSAQGVVRYLATSAATSLTALANAIAISANGDLVAVLSARHQWYGARFVAQVADVVADGRGCRADLGISGSSEQGGGVLVTSVVRYGAAARANVVAGDVITTWNGAALDSWDQLQSTLYLTPAYTTASITYDHGTQVQHSTVSFGCPSKLVK